MKDNASQGVARERNDPAVKLAEAMGGGGARLAILALAAAAGVGLLEAAQVYVGAAAAGAPLPWRRAVTGVLPYWLIFAAVLPVIVHMARRFPLERGRWGGAATVHVAGSIGFAWIHLLTVSWISDFVLYRVPAAYLDNLWRLFGQYFVMELIYYWAVVAVVHGVDNHRRFREREQEARRLAVQAVQLESSLARANLRALRMQLNPHFLFNTLNGISVLALRGDGRTVARMLTRLGDLLRVTLETSSHQVPLGEELDLVGKYLELERMRFSDRLTVRIDAQEPALEGEVPSLLLQPLVENAIRHGIADDPRPGCIEILARREGDRLRIEVRDSGPGFPSAGGGAGKGGGVGLANTRERLRQLYGEGASMEFRSGTGGGAVVTIDLPFSAARPLEAALESGALA
jgi:two-component system, LytTR family, sensor kinase